MKTGKVLLLAVVVGILLAGCEGQTSSDGVLRMGLATAPRNLDPKFATDATSERINLLYRRLVEFDTASRPVPALATWKQLTPTRYLFTPVGQGRVFSVGSRLDAEDVKVTYASILDPAGASPHRALLSIIRDIRTDGPGRVQALRARFPVSRLSWHRHPAGYADPERPRVSTCTRRQRTLSVPEKLIRYAGGERGVWRVVWVPDAAWENLRQLHREREDLLTERTRHRNWLSSKLVAQGIRFPIGKDFLARLEAVTLFEGSGLPAHLKAGLIREWERLQVVQAHLRTLEPAIGALIKGADSAQAVRSLMLLS